MAKINLTCIIDDDEIFVYAMKKLIHLKNLSHEMIIFDQVEEAIGYLRANHAKAELLPDVILLDINLPILDGWDFLDEYQELNLQMAKSPRIYMLSSSANPVDQKRAESYPAIANYYTKPLSKEAFKAVFES